MQGKVYYFIGIGGIGMSAIARYLKQTGNVVYGYDRVCTELTRQMEREGILITYQEMTEHIPHNVDLAIYTPAIGTDNKILQHVLEHNIPCVKRSVILGQIANEKKVIAVSGSHGKTTTSGMIAHLLHKSNMGASAFLGGISNNFSSNVLIDDKSDFVVVEADEYDRSFLQLRPYISAVTSIAADHLDIYKNLDNLKEAFSQFVNLTKPDGKIFLKQGLDVTTPDNTTTMTYSLSDLESDYYAWNIRTSNGAFYFDYHTPEKVYYDMRMNYPGIHNIENAVLAMGIAFSLGANEYEIRAGLQSFAGMKRRFELKYKSDKYIYYDDYAHHPEEIKTTISSLRQLYPQKRICGIFQPHLYSRTRDFAEEFAKALELLDDIILLPIDPAREEPIKGISSRTIMHKIGKMDKYYVEKDQLLPLLSALQPELLVSMGAGDIDRMVEPIIKTLKENE